MYESFFDKTLIIFYIIRFGHVYLYFYIILRLPFRVFDKINKTDVDID